MPTVLVKPLSANENEQTFLVSQGLVLFDELEHQGFVLPHGCLAGSCGSCRIEILKGAENLSIPGAIESDTIDNLNKQNYSGLNKTIRLSCRAKVLGDTTITILK
jgi:ferredoxin